MTISIPSFLKLGIEKLNPQLNIEGDLNRALVAFEGQLHNPLLRI